MFPVFASAETTRTPTVTTVACPVCGGPLADTGGLSRCARCQYVTCPSCDGERAEPVEGDGGDW